MTSPEARRNALILAEADRISKLDPDEIVIVAGITGSIPATVKLMGAVAARPSGAIVLPALDQWLDEASWNAIVPSHPEHPQFGLKKLLDGLGVERGAVRTLPDSSPRWQSRARSAFVAKIHASLVFDGSVASLCGDSRQRPAQECSCRNITHRSAVGAG